MKVSISILISIKNDADYLYQTPMFGRE